MLKCFKPTGWWSDLTAEVLSPPPHSRVSPASLAAHVVEVAELEEVLLAS